MLPLRTDERTALPATGVLNHESASSLWLLFAERKPDILRLQPSGQHPVLGNPHPVNTLFLTLRFYTVNLHFMPNYNATIAEFQKQLESLLQQREQLDRQIAGVTAVIEAIKTLADESDESLLEVPPMPPNEEAGFTDRVRAILKANPALALSAVVIRDEFLKAAPKEDPKIFLIHTHNTLKRLHRQGEVEEVTTSAGRAYRWKFPDIDEKMRAAIGRKTFGQRFAVPSLDPTPDHIEDAMKATFKRK